MKVPLNQYLPHAHCSIYVCYFGADLRGKELAMRLMMHPDAEVQKQALLAVQKILLAKDKVAYLNN